MGKSLRLSCRSELTRQGISLIVLRTIELSIVEPDVSAGFCMSPYSSDYIFIIRNRDDVWRVVSEDSGAYRRYCFA